MSDTGIGIPAELRERIYEPFFSMERIDRQAGGIGLGLSITRKLVRLMGGTVEVESEFGKGTTIRFRLPAAS